MSLQKYHDKRNFKNTNEPKGKIKKENKKRFVIQYHQARAKHYDFRLEYDGVLLSWAVPKGLSFNPKDKRLAVMVEDHPLDYIDFEGIIPKGNYGAGTVEVYDQGTYFPYEEVGQSIKKGHLKFVLRGQKYQGEWSLINLKENNWLIIKSVDEYSHEKVINTRLPFQNCSVQLATLSNKIPNGKNWIYEIKYDGYRILSYYEKGQVKLLSRNEINYTNKFKRISESLTYLEQDSFVLDGEIVSFDKNGRSDFGLLQDNVKKQNADFYYIIFDLLALNGEDMRSLPLFKRKDKLEKLLYKARNNLIYSKHFNQGKECFNFAKKNNLEGIIAKKVDSKYEGKRTADWLKIKSYHRQEFVIGGYTTSVKNEIISSLLLGYYYDKDFVYVGKVGTGLSEKLKRELLEKFKKIIRKTSPFTNLLKEKNITWLKPSVIAEIQYVELTREKLLRQPSFIGLREDKEVKKVTLEEI